jgi:hypothetical protein
MNRGTVGEERGGKTMDGCPFTVCLKLTKSISLATAKHWMKHVSYPWTKMPLGQYVDEHERN